MKKYFRKLSVFMLTILFCGSLFAAFCAKCGKKIGDDAKFCRFCGHKVGTPVKPKKVKPKPKPKPAPVYESIEEANNYFELAEKEKSSIGALILPNIKRKRYSKALSLYLKILEKWPNSDKCEASAYKAAEIYESVAFKKWNKAIHYYNMVIEINPETTMDARLRIAKVTEDDIHDYKSAVALYEDTIANARVQSEKLEAAASLKKLKEKMKREEEKIREMKE
jgi:tetratricopeptide (TPR) repeat protein